MPAITLENEVAAWKYIGRFASDLLAKYPTTMEDDQNIME